MKRQTILQVLVILLLATVSSLALGGLGGGGGSAPPEDDTVRVTMKPLVDDGNVYGWVRITPDRFAVGANRLEPDTYYAVYLVSGDKREPMTEKPARRRIQVLYQTQRAVRRRMGQSRPLSAPQWRR